MTKEEIIKKAQEIKHCIGYGNSSCSIKGDCNAPCCMLCIHGVFSTHEITCHVKPHCCSCGWNSLDKLGRFVMLHLRELFLEKGGGSK